MSLAGKIYLVTGSSDGIGLHTATRLAGLGATVLVHGRDPVKAANAVAEVRSLTGNSHVHGFDGDFSDFADIRRFASEVSQRFDHIDCLINNAGVFSGRQRELTTEGYELTYGINVQALYLVTCLLLSKIKERVINVSSISAGSQLDWSNLEGEKRYSADAQYATSKLAVMMITVELAHRLGQPPPAVHCLDPGTVNSKLLDKGWGMIGMDVKDANDEFFLATDPNVAKTTGKYFVGRSERRMPSVVQDNHARRKLWDLLVEQTGCNCP